MRSADSAPRSASSLALSSAVGICASHGIGIPQPECTLPVELAGCVRDWAAMLLTEIDHVAIAVRDLEAAIDFYARAFGATVDHREGSVESDGVEEALLKVADSYVQLLTPTRDDSPVAKALDKRGEGLHHIGYRVADCAAALESMKAAGATPIDAAPRPGSRGTTVAFIHPKSSFGTLIELVEEQSE